MTTGIPRDSQCQYLIKCVGDQRCRCATILILALGSPSSHMAYIGTPAPLILPRPMAQHYMLFCFSLMQILYIVGLLIVTLLSCVHSQGMFHHSTICALPTHSTRAGYQPDVITHDNFVSQILVKVIVLGPSTIAYKVKYSEECQSACL